MTGRHRDRRFAPSGRASVCSKAALAVALGGAFLGSLFATEPRDVEPRFFDSAGVRIHFTDEGAGDAVLLIHGYAGAGNWWRDQDVTAALVGAGFRVIAYDNRGHGRSDRPHAPDKYGSEMVADATRLLDHLGVGRAHVVGYSMGAVIANKLRSEHPDRLLSVTLAGYGRPPLPDRYSDELVREIESNLRAMNLGAGNDPVALALVSLGWSEWEVAAADLRENALPALALVGEDDPFLPDTQDLARRMPGLTVKIVPGDHGTAAAQPAFAAELIEHLRSATAKHDP